MIKRYEMYAPKTSSSSGPVPGDGSEQHKAGHGDAQPEAHASDHPMMVMIDEMTGNRYMRMVPSRGLGEDGDNSWLVKDMHEEWKSWVHPGGGKNAFILKGDGEPAIVAVREALARCNGGLITPEQPRMG